MRNSTMSLLLVAKQHKKCRGLYERRYGKKLGMQLYIQSRNDIAEFLMELCHATRKTQYFRNDCLMIN